MFLQNKYTKWYFNIIAKAQRRASTRKEAKAKLDIIEGHHIYPRCIASDPSIVYLTPKEHFVCHWLLTKMTSDNSQKIKLNHAFSFMSANRTLSPYEIYRAMKAKHQPCSKTRRQNISNSRKNTTKKKCPHCSKSCDPGNYKQFHGDNCKLNPNISQEVLTKISYRNKTSYLKSKEAGTHYTGKIISETPIVCPQCGKHGTNKLTMRRFHFMNCANSPTHVRIPLQT